jgi:hypothetical protein
MACQGFGHKDHEQVMIDFVFQEKAAGFGALFPQEKQA